MYMNVGKTALATKGCFESDPSSCLPLTEYVELNTEEKRRETAVIPYATAGDSKLSRQRSQTSAQTKAHKNWRYTMEEQLKLHANEDGFVMLSAVNYGYRHHAINFKCGLERVGMTDNFVIGALDDDMYVAR